MGSTAGRGRPEPLSRLVRFDASDGVELSGLLFEPHLVRLRPRGRVIVFLHGTGGGSVFTARRTNILGEEITRRGFAFLAFDNRGSHLVRRLRYSRSGPKRRDELGGMGFELIRDAVADIEGVVRFLRRRGYRDITLVGHSTGANKIAVYDFYTKRNLVQRYVLFAGADDAGLMHEQLGARRFHSALARARERRRSPDFVPRSISSLPMSWRAFHDMVNPDGDYNVFPFLEAMGRVKLSRKPLFRHLRAIRKPSFMIYGERDEYCFGDVRGCVASMAKVLPPNFEFVIVKDADHGFGEREDELAGLITDWAEG